MKALSPWPWVLCSGGSSLLIGLALLLYGQDNEVSQSGVSSPTQFAAADAAGKIEPADLKELPSLSPDELEQVPPHLRAAYCAERIRELYAQVKAEEGRVWQSHALLRKATHLAHELSRDPLAGALDLKAEYRSFIADHPELRETLISVDHLLILRATLKISSEKDLSLFLQDGLAHGGLQEDFERLLARADAASGYKPPQRQQKILDLAGWQAHLGERLPSYDAAIAALTEQIPSRIIEAMVAERETATARFFVSYFKQSLLSGTLYDTVQALKGWRAALRQQFPKGSLPPELSDLYAQTGHSILF